MVDRMMRAARADISLYEEAEHNQSLTSEAFTVVAIVAVISAIGTAVWTAAMGGNIVTTVIANLIGAIVGYVLWAYITFFVGTRLFNGQAANAGEVLRPLGYAYTPQVLSFIPCVNLVVWIWTLYLGFVAVRQGLDLDNTKTALTVIVAVVVAFVVQLIIGTVLGVGAAGLDMLMGG